MKLLTNFINYQKSRFPLFLIIPTTFSAMLGTSVLFSEADIKTIALGTILSVAFLFHIRVIDEVRDFTHDQRFHSYRPLHQGLIKLSELKTLRIISLGLFFAISFYFSLETFICAIVLFVYSSFAARDFFISAKIRKYFFVYNFLNMLQLIGLQMILYIALGWDFKLGGIIAAHLLIIFLLSLLLEMIRKIKLPVSEGEAKDTYSHHLGFHGSLTALVLTSIATLVPLYFILNSLTVIVPSFFVFVLVTILSFIHSKRKSDRTEKALFLGTLVYYLTINITIFISLS